MKKCSMTVNVLLVSFVLMSLYNEFAIADLSGSYDDSNDSSDPDVDPDNDLSTAYEPPSMSSSVSDPDESDPDESAPSDDNMRECTPEDNDPSNSLSSMFGTGSGNLLKFSDGFSCYYDFGFNQIVDCFMDYFGFDHNGGFRGCQRSVLDLQGIFDFIKHYTGCDLINEPNTKCKSTHQKGKGSALGFDVDGDNAGGGPMFHLMDDSKSTPFPMTLAFRNQLSQTAKQMRMLLATPPPDWTEENLIEFLCKELAVSVPDLKSNLWDETIRNWAEKVLQSSTLRTTHLRPNERNFRINCHRITLGSSYSHGYYDSKRGRYFSIKDHYAIKQHITLRYPYLPCIAVQGGGTHENLYPMEILTISSLQPVLQPPAAQESTELPDQAPPTAAGPILSDQQTSRSSSPSSHQPGAQPADQRSPTDQQNVTVTVGGHQGEDIKVRIALPQTSRRTTASFSRLTITLCLLGMVFSSGTAMALNKSPLINLEISRTDSPVLGLMSNLLTEIDINTAAFHQTAPLAINSTADFSMAEGNGAAKREQGEALRKSIRELRRRRDPALAPAITTLREQFEQLNLEGPEGQLTDTTASASSSSESSSSRSSSKSEGELAEPSKQLKLAEPAKVLKKPTPPRVAGKRPPITSLVHSEAKEAKEKKCSACNKMGHISTNRNCPARRGEYRIPLKRRRGTPTYRSPLSREPPSHNNTAPSTSRAWNSTQPSTSRAGNSNLSRQDIRRICQTEILHAFEDFVKKLLRDLEGRR
ncbi:hypothetical protein DdX_08312 [Ditylenchus destructor]|uniref:PAZ domain-containing protein n=1 Tax=Ditylenchus destructor TaxID=166010 RepID=A0AAD4N768_9BILA|nr:hypothetical protein DdX_08312 [Ditylenchus destructor]